MLNKCIHTGQHCPHAARCTLNVDECKSEACVNKIAKRGVNVRACMSCYKYRTRFCRFACFRIAYKDPNSNTLATLKARGDIAKFKRSRENTPYKIMKRSGELAAFAATNLAKHGRLPVVASVAVDAIKTSNADKNAIAVDNEAQRGV